MTNKIIEVQNIKVNITNMNDSDYICISDFTKFKEGKSTSDDVIRNWLRNRITLEFLGTWESIYNLNFNSVEFDGFKSEAGLHTFTLSVTDGVIKRTQLGYIRNVVNMAELMLIKTLLLNLHLLLVQFLNYI